MIVSIKTQTRLSDAIIFRRVEKFAYDQWTALDRRPVPYFRTGVIKAWGKKVLTALGYNPCDHRIHLNSRVADNVSAEPAHFNKNIFQLPDTIYDTTQARYDPDSHTVLIETKCTCLPYEDDIFENVQILFEDLKKISNNKLLYLVLKDANANFLGTPIDIFDRKED